MESEQQIQSAAHGAVGETVILLRPPLPADRCSLAASFNHHGPIVSECRFIGQEATISGRSEPSGQTVILLHPPPPSSRVFNMDAEEGRVGRMTVSPTALGAGVSLPTKTERWSRCRRSWQGLAGIAIGETVISLTLSLHPY